MSFVECSGNSAPMFSNEPVQATAQALHGLVSNAEWTGVPLSILLDEAGVDPNAKWVIAEGADAHALDRSVPMKKAHRRRADRALPERRAADARQRLSDAAPAARLPGQHEREIPAPPQGRRSAGHELVREQDLFAAPAGRQGVALPLPAGGEELHHPSVVRADAEDAGLLRDLRRRLFRHRPHRQGHGLGGRRQELGRGRAAGPVHPAGVHPLPHAVALGRPAGRAAKPRLGRGRQRAAAARGLRRGARRDQEAGHEPARRSPTSTTTASRAGASAATGRSSMSTRKTLARRFAAR